VHSYGISVRGWYQPTDAAERYTAAPPLVNREPVTPVTVRFSNGTADEGSPDCRRDARGMAVRFHDGHGEPAFDMVCMTLPVFFVREVASFRRFTAAAVPPDPPRGRRWWDGLVDALNLREPPADPAPSDAALVAFSVAHPEACPALVANYNEKTPESFAARSYHPVHAFRLTAADGSSRFVRFHWEPLSGVRNTTTTAEHYLQPDLRERATARSVQFVLRAQVAEHGDDTADVTRPWPQTRRRVVLGHLTLDGPVDEAAACEDLAFDPSHLPPGIDPDPGDEIFRRARRRVPHLGPDPEARARPALLIGGARRGSRAGHPESGSSQHFHATAPSSS